MGSIQTVIGTYFYMDLVGIVACYRGFCSSYFVLLGFHISVNSSYVSGQMTLMILNGTLLSLWMSGKIKSVPDKVKIFESHRK